ncbi:hypothetical protein M0R45_025614 [Rubus argutus]|uniref:Secreted protein n=1 Tax=Rubus argutus TaxID=59490 RepID=A0AAW1WXJ9_RUBAR
MAQAAFLSALASVEVAKAAPCAAVTPLLQLCKADYETCRMSLASQAWNAKWHGMLLVINSAQSMYCIWISTCRGIKFVTHKIPQLRNVWYNEKWNV